MRDTAGLLRELRRAQGRSLRAAATELGIAPSQLSRLERGERRPTPDLVDRLANYYHLSPDIIALSEGRIPLDIVTILREHPEELNRLRRLYPKSAGPENHE